jgi:hypothetical protein
VKNLNCMTVRECNVGPQCHNQTREHEVCHISKDFVLHSGRIQIYLPRTTVLFARYFYSTYV